MLQPMELLDVAETLASARRLRAFLGKMNDHYPLIGAIAGTIVPQERIEQEIGRCIASSGEVVDSASAALACGPVEHQITHAADGAAAQHLSSRRRIGRPSRTRWLRSARTAIASR